MAWYKKISIPFKLYDSATGSMADWTVIFRNEISGGSADVTLQSAAKLKKLGEFNMEFNITDNEFIMPNFDMVLADPYRDSNNTSLFDFICNPLSYGIKTQVQVYIYKGAVLTYKFFTDRTKLQFNDKTYELKVRSIVDHVSPGNLLLRDENKKMINPLDIQDAFGVSPLMYVIWQKIAAACGLAITGYPLGWSGLNYKFGGIYKVGSSTDQPSNTADVTDWSEIRINSLFAYYALRGRESSSGTLQVDRLLNSWLKTVKDVIAYFNDSLQIIMGSDEFGNLFVRQKIRFTGFISIPDSEVMSIEFEEWEEKVGAYATLQLTTGYGQVIEWTERAGNVVVDDERQLKNTEQVYTVDREDLCSRASLYTYAAFYACEIWRYNPEDAADVACNWYINKIPKTSGDESYEGGGKFMVNVLYNLLKMTKGRVAVKVRGTERKIFEDYTVNFYYANGNSIALNIAVDKITKNLVENYTIIRGFVVGDAPFVEKYPSNQPTNLTFTNLAANTLTANWDRAASAVTGYVAFSHEVTAPAIVPADNTIYTPGSTYSGDKCIASGDVVTADLTGLTGATNIHVSVWSYNDVGGVRYYYPGYPLTGYQSTLQSIPGAQPTNFVIYARGETTLTIRITPSVTSPLADGFLAIAKPNSYSGFVPAPGVVYTLGQNIPTGAIVAFIGAGTGTTPRDLILTGLLPATAYNIEIFSYRGSGSVINYLTTGTILKGIAETLAEFGQTAICGLSFSGVTPSQIVAVISSNGVADGVTIVYNTITPTAVPVDSNVYSDFDIIGGGTDRAFDVNFASSLDRTLTGLSANTDYHFKVYPFKGYGVSRNYQTSPSPPDLIQRTLSVTNPTTQPLNFSVRQDVANFVICSADNNNPSFDGIVIYRKRDTASSAVPVDGTTPTVITTNTPSDVCIYKGPATPDCVSRPTDDNYDWHFRAFAFNGDGAGIKFNEFSPPTAIFYTAN